jgi:hypothetical protein
MLSTVYVYFILGQPVEEAGHTKFCRTGFVIEFSPVVFMQYFDV